jgi:Peptidase family M28
MRCLAVFIGIITICFGTSAVHAEPRLEAQLRAHIAILASDEFEGREPGTPGEQKTIEYIADSWRSAKLRPAANDGSWFAPVSLVQRSPDKSKFAFYVSGRRLNFVSDEIVLSSRDQSYSVRSLPVFFGGHGVKNDGRGLDGVKGKLVLMLSAPAEKGAAALMSLETRRSALIQAGAEAVLVVADGDNGSWSAIRRQSNARTTALASSEKRAALQGGVSSEFAVGLVTAAKRDWDGLRKAAGTEEFDGQDLGIVADFDVQTFVRKFDSYNVIGKISGRKKGSGAIVYMAHWDHLGICRPEGNADRICNGAVDNASGIAVITEVARNLTKKRFDRDIYFVATTAEEMGLLGAYSFADSPPVPIDTIKAAFNIDTIAVTSAGSKAAIVGRGKTSLDGPIEQIAAKMGRTVDMSDAANSYLQRQDGWALSQKGVAALMVNSSFSDIPALEAFLGSKYHRPDDELSDATDLSGAAEDVLLHIEMGKYFASQRSFKGNKTGS